MNYNQMLPTHKILEKNRSTVAIGIKEQQTQLKQTTQTVTPMILAGLTKTCLNTTYRKWHTDEHLPDVFSIPDELKLNALMEVPS
jgi:hypothetical protein